MARLQVPEVTYRGRAAKGLGSTSPPRVKSDPLGWDTGMQRASSYTSIASNTSITSQILSCAAALGENQSLEYLLEDALSLHKKLEAIFVDLERTPPTSDPVKKKEKTLQGHARERSSTSPAMKWGSSTGDNRSRSRNGKYLTLGRRGKHWFSTLLGRASSSENINNSASADKKNGRRARLRSYGKQLSVDADIHLSKSCSSLDAKRGNSSRDNLPQGRSDIDDSIDITRRWSTLLSASGKGQVTGSGDIGPHSTSESHSQRLSLDTSDSDTRLSRSWSNFSSALTSERTRPASPLTLTRTNSPLGLTRRDSSPDPAGGQAITASPPVLARSDRHTVSGSSNRGKHLSSASTDSGWWGGSSGESTVSDSKHWSMGSSTSGVSDDQPPPSQSVGVRPSVADFVDELTEVEHKVSGVEPRSPSDESSQHTNITASTATRELDELMQNLSKFEPSPAEERDYSKLGRSSQKPKSAVDDLNSMLGSLDQEMTQVHGVSTVAKGTCAACQKPILAKVVNALGRQWHPEHFTCTSCDAELATTTYYESNGRPYCEKDFHELYAPRCAYCNGPILERVMRALDKTWHPEHFFCTLCGKHFGPEGFHEKDNKAFCRECYYEKFAPRCKRCEKAIMEGYVTALNAQWHPECFSCKICGVTFPRGNYYDHEGEPHCEIHYHASRGTLCASCQKPVTGKSITAMGKKWHPEHFTCAFCLKLLNKGTFKEHRHNPYCQPCYIKLFG